MRRHHHHHLHLHSHHRQEKAIESIVRFFSTVTHSSDNLLRLTNYWNVPESFVVLLLVVSVMLVMMLIVMLMMMLMVMLMMTVMMVTNTVLVNC